MTHRRSEYEPTLPLDPHPYEPPYEPYEPYPTAQPQPYGHQVVPQPQPYPQQPYPQQPSPYGGVPYGAMVDPRWAQYQASLYASQKSRLAAGLLGIFLGTLGVHNFYLGRTAVAVIQLLISLLSVGLLAPVVAIWALIEGIMILAGATSFRTDARGIPLRD